MSDRVGNSMNQDATSLDTCARVHAISPASLLSFSTGKDAVASWLQCRKVWGEAILPYYMYLVPALEFVEDSLMYYERFFGCRIKRVPHPSLYRQLDELLFQPPHRCQIIEAAALPAPKATDLEDDLRSENPAYSGAYAAIGVRAVDNLPRRISIKRYGAIVESKRHFYPIWDWRKADLVEAFRVAGVHLTADYKYIGCSFDGLGYRYLKPIKDHFPRDFERILEYYPLADIEIFRQERMA